jgi:hypothetical protein
MMLIKRKVQWVKIYGLHFQNYSIIIIIIIKEDLGFLLYKGAANFCKH